MGIEPIAKTPKALMLPLHHIQQYSQGLIGLEPIFSMPQTNVLPIKL